MAKEIHVSTTDCSYEKLVRVAQQCGFLIIEGRKHCKIKTSEGRFVTTIPRHSHLKRETAKGIIKAFNESGGNISFS